MATAPRTPLTRERVLAAAVTLADEGGVEALSMRRIGQQLGVEAMSLYNHVDNKDDILAGIVDIVVGEIELPATGLNWKAALRTIAISAHDVLVDHPWACSLLMSTTGAGPARLRYMNSVLGALRAGGFSIELTHHAFHAFENHIVGYTQQQINFPYDAAELAEVGAAFLSRLSVDDYPHLAEHVRHHLESEDEQSGFEFGLDLILDGLESLKPASD